MKFTILRNKQEWIHLSLSVLVGVVVATSVIALLVAEKIGAMHLAHWQIAALYVVIVAASIRVGVRDSAEISHTN